MVDSSGRFPITKSTNILVKNKYKLAGMPEFFGNISLGYDLGGFQEEFQCSINWNMTLHFTAGGYSDRITKAYTRFDLSLKQRITTYFSVYLNVNNITNVEDGFYVQNRVFLRKQFDQSEKYGGTADFGITLNL